MHKVTIIFNNLRISLSFSNVTTKSNYVILPLFYALCLKLCKFLSWFISKVIFKTINKIKLYSSKNTISSENRLGAHFIIVFCNLGYNKTPLKYSIKETRVYVCSKKILCLQLISITVYLNDVLILLMLMTLLVILL